MTESPRSGSPSVDQDPQKAALHEYLCSSREALLWKLEGLPERELRRPRTATGTNLLGIVKHMANVEIGYFGDTFGRPWPGPEPRVTDEMFAQDLQADWYATESETAQGVIGFYRHVWEFADATIVDLPLDAPGQVPWWPADRAPVSLQRIMVHVLVDLTRHLGQADVLREGLDGAVGMRRTNSNLPEGMDWPAYVDKLEQIADRF